MYFHIYTPLFPLHLTCIYFLFFHVQHLLQNGTHFNANLFKNYFTIWIDLCSFGYVSLTWMSPDSKNYDRELTSFCFVWHTWNVNRWNAKFVSLRQMKVNKKVLLLCLRALIPYFLSRPNRVHLSRRNVLAKLRFITSKDLFEPDD